MTAAQRLAWLCDELAAGNDFSPDLLRIWAQEARSEGDIPAPLTGPYHGPHVADQFKLLLSLIGTQSPQGLREMREIVLFLKAFFPKPIA